MQASKSMDSKEFADFCHTKTKTEEKFLKIAFF